jgi:hypothetical protein
MRTVLRHVLEQNERMLYLRLRTSTPDQFVHELIDAIAPALELLEEALLHTWNDNQREMANDKTYALDSIAGMSGQILDADDCHLYTKEGSTNRLVGQGSYGGLELLEPPAVVFDSFKSHKVTLSGQTICAPVLYAPLEGQCLGVLYCARRAGVAFDLQDGAALACIGELCSPAVASVVHADAPEAYDDKVRCQRAGMEIFNVLISGETDLQEVLTHAADSVSVALRCEQVAIFLQSRFSSKLIPYLMSGEDYGEPDVSKANMRLGAGQVAKSGKWDSLRRTAEQMLATSQSMNMGLTPSKRRTSMHAITELRPKARHDGYGRKDFHSTSDADPCIAMTLYDKRHRTIGVLVASNPGNSGGDFRPEDKELLSELGASVEFAVNDIRERTSRMWPAIHNFECFRGLCASMSASQCAKRDKTRTGCSSRLEHCGCFPARAR